MGMSGKASCRKAFADMLLTNAKQNKDIVMIALDSYASVSLDEYVEQLTEQYVELGIAEQNGIAVAAGLSKTGKNVFVCSPSSFLMARSYEQVKVDVAYNRSNVKVVGISAGVSYGPLGGTHTALHDLAGARALANLHIYVPSDAVQTAFITNHLTHAEGPAFLRLGRGDVYNVYEPDEAFETEKAKTVNLGNDACILACGEMVYPASMAAKVLQEKGLSVRVLDLFCLKPVDRDAIIRAAEETGAILTVEEHSVNGGLGELAAHILAEHCPVPMKIMGFPDEDIVIGKSMELFEHYGLTAENIAHEMLSLLEKKRG